MRICLNAEHFKTLVSGGVIRVQPGQAGVSAVGEPTEIILAGIGFAGMLAAIQEVIEEAVAEELHTGGTASGQICPFPRDGRGEPDPFRAA